MHPITTLQQACMRRLGSIAAKHTYPPLPASFFSPKPTNTDFSHSKGRTTADFPFLFIKDFITDKEHDMLAAEAEKDLKRRRYEAGHWDAVITHFREQSKGFPRWSPDCQIVFERVRALFPRPTQLMMPSAHVLDLDKNGIIDHHIDSVKFSGDIVCGISLLSDSIMELRHDPDSVFVKDYVRAEGAPVIDEKAAAEAPRVRVLLPKKSLYMVIDETRFEWSHAILSGDHEFVSDAARLAANSREACEGSVNAEHESEAKMVVRDRRISLIFRDELR